MRFIGTHTCNQSLIAGSGAEYHWDEFGFRIDDGDEQHRFLEPFVETSQHRLRWIAHLEFTHNQVLEELTWDKVHLMLPR